MAERRIHDPAGTATALALALLGGVVAWQARGFSTMASVFPLTIALAMVALCLILVARNLLKGRREAPPALAEPAMDADPHGGSNARRVALLAVMAAWVALIPVLGFFVSSLAGFLGAMAVALHERPDRREAIILAVSAVAFPLAFYLLMVEVLRIPMPRALLF